MEMDVEVDVSCLRTQQRIMLRVALEREHGTTCAEISRALDRSTSIVHKRLIRLLKLENIYRRTASQLGRTEGRKGDNRVFYFPTKKGINYINYVLKKNNLDILTIPVKN